MSKILEAIDQLAASSYPPGWDNPAIRKFIETGDEALLQSIPPFGYGWTSGLSAALPDPDEWTDEAQRVLMIARSKNLQNLIKDWFRRNCRGSDVAMKNFHPAVEILTQLGFSKPEINMLLLGAGLWFDDPPRLAPPGTMLLEAPDKELYDLLRHVNDAQVSLGALLARFQPDRLEGFLKQGLQFGPYVYRNLLQANPQRFSHWAYQRFNELKDNDERTCLIFDLAQALPETYLATACEEARKHLQSFPVDPDSRGYSCVEFMLKQHQPDALEAACKWMETTHTRSIWSAVSCRRQILQWATENQPAFVIPMAEACTRNARGEIVLLGLQFWKQQGTAGTEEAYHQALRSTLNHSDSATVVSAINDIREWDAQRACDDLWPLMAHKSRPVRNATARALATLGFDAASGKALPLLAHKKADAREATVLLLSMIGGTDAMGSLKQRLDIEENDAIRDAILLALERGGSAASLTPEEQQARIAKTLEKSKAPPAAWVHPECLALKRQDGSVLSTDEVLYLLIRQSRCKDMRADLEARPLYATLDRAASADAALALMQAFLASPQDAGDRWALAFAALTGDDRIVPVLRKAIIEWADANRGKLAEYATQALALLGTDPALMVVDSLAIRFRSKNKNIGHAATAAFADAAEARGVSVEELGDLVVPWLGFEPGQPRLVETAKGRAEMRISADFKLEFRDTKSGKISAKPPAGSPADFQAELKTLTVTLKEAQKAQLLRLETLLVRQYRWPVAAWRDLYLTHPLLRPFSQRLIWGWRDATGALSLTFRALEDCTLTDVTDAAVTLPDDGSVSLVHPLDLDEATRADWTAHLADYDISPPFPQLDRPVVRVTAEDAATKFGMSVHGTSLNAMTFRGRAEKLGWVRGSVCDAGCVGAYRKVYSGAGVEAYLRLDGMYVGISRDDSITLQEMYFVKAGSVEVGSYVYDEPADGNDPRVLGFGEVPPVPFSETMGDLVKISGKAATEENITNS